MKLGFLLAVCLIVGAVGCDYIAPGTSKAITEKAQLETAEQELVQLERIASALEKLAKE